VGHIYEVGSTWSKVIALIDPKFSAGAVIVRTGDLAVAEGNTETSLTGRCVLSYIDKNSAVMAGDYVETNGLGGIYPKGLLIGKVKEVSTDSQGLYRHAVVEPGVNFARLNEVLIILN
jgi:rod shape-determining protein MreC